MLSQCYVASPATAFIYSRNRLHASNPKGLYASGLFGYATGFFEYINTVAGRHFRPCS